MIKVRFVGFALMVSPFFSYAYATDYIYPEDNMYEEFQDSDVDPSTDNIVPDNNQFEEEDEQQNDEIEEPEDDSR